MGVRLSDDEAWAVIAVAHTGMLTTLRRDGMPITLPVWFVAIDRTICMVAPAHTKKVARIRNDPRASFLVESGERWAELQAVHLTGRVEMVEGESDVGRIDDALGRKYGPFRTDPSVLPDATRRHYGQRTFLRFCPDGKILSWDNRRLRLEGS